MKLDTLERRFLLEMQEHPNTTAFRLNGEIVTNALFTQRIAPIMNEFDTMPETKIAVLIEQDLQNYAALPAALFVGKQLVPISTSWTETQRNQVLKDAGIATCLTAHRMQYYFRMTYEDALDRIDNGLYIEPIDPIATLYSFDAAGTLSSRDVFIEDIPEKSDLIDLVCSFFKQF